MYWKKRNFRITSELFGHSLKKDTSDLIFVVHKHAASHLHYDFRLEMEGVLKSWACPKGPSLNPHHKRLAIQTEDHPLEYKDFEGIIPEGQYGAGTVIVWDYGTYEPSAFFKKGFSKGHLTFTLKGQKLKGEFILQKLKKVNKSQWLLIKVKDQFANSCIDITTQDKSVMSGKTLKEINPTTSYE